MSSPSPQPEERSYPLPAPTRFSDREIELAHQMVALGLKWELVPGLFLYDDAERIPDLSPLQPHVYFVLDFQFFIEVSGGRDKIPKTWTWLPTFEQAREWLKNYGKNNAEILDRVREAVVDRGLSDREAMYELMIGVLKEGHPQQG